MKDPDPLSTEEDKFQAGQDQAPGEERNDGLFVASLAKGMKVLESFKDRKQGLSLTEITQASGIGKGAAQRAVATLHTIGYLMRDDHAKTYRLSPKVLALSRDYLSVSTLSETAMPFLRQLGDDFGETINLSERIGDELVVIGRMPGKQVLTINVGIGTRAPLISTAPGLVLLAFSDRENATDFVRRADIYPWTSQTVTDRDRILEWLGEIRREGFSLARQLMHEGEISIAAPVFGEEPETAVAAINLSAPLGRWSEAAIQGELVPAVKRTALNISNAMGRTTT